MRLLAGWQWAIFGLILLIGAGFRIAQARSHSLSFDEEWHLELSTGRGSEHIDLPRDVLIPYAPDVTSLNGAGPWYSVWTHMSGVVHPPLYCLTMRIWREIFGPTDLAACLLSVVCALITIVLMFIAALSINGFTAAAWAALIFAVAPTQLWISNEVRGYAMLQAVGMAGVLALIGLEKSPSKIRAAILGLCVLAMMLVHYFAIAGVIAIAAYVCIRFRGKKLRLALAALAIAGLVYAIVWLPFMLPQRAAMHDADSSWLIEHSSSHLFLTFQRLALWPWKSAVTYVGDEPWPYFASLILVIPLFMLRHRPALLIWYLWVWGTLGFLAALDLIRGTRHLLIARYVALAAPGMFVLFTAMLEDLLATLRHGLPAAAVIGSLIFVRFYLPQESDWGAMGEIIDREAKPEQVLLFYHGSLPDFFTEFYYIGIARYSHNFPRAIVKLAHPSPSLMKQLSNQTAWLITAPNSTAQEILPGATELRRIDAPNQGVCIEVQLPTTP